MFGGLIYDLLTQSLKKQAEQTDTLSKNLFYIQQEVSELKKEIRELASKSDNAQQMQLDFIQHKIQAQMDSLTCKFDNLLSLVDILSHKELQIVSKEHNP